MGQCAVVCHGQCACSQDLNSRAHWCLGGFQNCTQIDFTQEQKESKADMMCTLTGNTLPDYWFPSGFPLMSLLC